MLKKTKPEECQKVDPSDDLEDLAKRGFDTIQMKFKSGIKHFEIISVHPKERMGYGICQ